MHEGIPTPSTVDCEAPLVTDNPSVSFSFGDKQHEYQEVLHDHG